MAAVHVLRSSTPRMKSWCTSGVSEKARIVVVIAARTIVGRDGRRFGQDSQRSGLVRVGRREKIKRWRCMDTLILSDSTVASQEHVDNISANRLVV